MKVKIVKLPKGNVPEWIKLNEEYEVAKDRPRERGFVMLRYKGCLYNIEEYCVIDAGSDDCKPTEPLQIRVCESQLKAFRKAAILAREYCQEVKLNHESKMGDASWRRSDEVLHQGLKKDLEFLEDVVECFEDIWPEDYI